MHKFSYDFLISGVIPVELFSTGAKLEKYKLLSEQRKDKYETIYTALESISKFNSVKYSNAIEGIITTDDRINEIVNHSAAPVGHTEMEIAGYSNALNYIHTNYKKLEFNQDLIRRLHYLLGAGADYDNAGKYKEHDNIITKTDIYTGERTIVFKPVSAADTQYAMDQLELAYIDARDTDAINKLLLIPCVILDFLCIHPFSDGNGRVSRLLTLLLLYKHGYEIGKYISIEEKINSRKNIYYSALSNSSHGWHTNTNTYNNFMRFFISNLYECYKDLDNKFAVLNGKRVNKTARIEATLLNSLTPLSKSEICNILPDVSPTTVEAVVGKMKKEGKIKLVNGSTKSAKYIAAHLSFENTGRE